MWVAACVEVTFTLEGNLDCFLLGCGGKELQVQNQGTFRLRACGFIPLDLNFSISKPAPVRCLPPWRVARIRWGETLQNLTFLNIRDHDQPDMTGAL